MNCNSLKNINREVWLRFRCLNRKCSNYHEEGNERSIPLKQFKKISGFICFSFYFEKLKKGNPPLLRISLRTKIHACPACHQNVSQGDIYATVMKDLARIYAILIEKIWN